MADPAPLAARDRLRLLVAGAGVAGLETLVALHTLGAQRALECAARLAQAFGAKRQQTANRLPTEQARLHALVSGRWT